MVTILGVVSHPGDLTDIQIAIENICNGDNPVRTGSAPVWLLDMIYKQEISPLDGAFYPSPQI